MIGQVNHDLDLLEAALTAARAEWRTSGSAGPAPLERLVLYIDDLDRCPPNRVVDVLTAIHLLLAKRLFIVVVAVDAAWLRRSLTVHHAAMFTGTEADDSTPATPVDWLDKIFQIPFALRPIEATAADYLAALLPPPPTPTSPPVGAPHPPTTHPLPDRPPPPNIPADLRPTVPSHRTDTRPTELRVSPRATHRASVPDLRPAGLALTDAERATTPLVGPLLTTPRSGKKLVNLYRLVRIGVPEADLPGFTSGPYQAVLLLLTVVVTRPALARPLLTALTTLTSTIGDVASFLRENSWEEVTSTEKVGGKRKDPKTSPRRRLRATCTRPYLDNRTD